MLPTGAWVEKHPCLGHPALGPRGRMKREKLQVTVKLLLKMACPTSAHTSLADSATGPAGVDGLERRNPARRKAATVNGAPHAAAHALPATSPFPPSYTRTCARTHTHTHAPSSPEGRPLKAPPTEAADVKPGIQPTGLRVEAFHHARPPRDHGTGRKELLVINSCAASCPRRTSLKLQSPCRPRIHPAAASRMRARQVTDGLDRTSDLAARPSADHEDPTKTAPVAFGPSFPCFSLTPRSSASSPLVPSPPRLDPGTEPIAWHSARHSPS